MFMFATSIIDYILFNDFVAGVITPAMFVYIGTTMVLSVCLLSAGYIVLVSAKAAISFEDGFAFTYRGYSNIGNNVAIFEVVFAVLFILTSLTITISALMGASDIWSTVELRELAVASDGFYGTAVSMMDALKLGVLGTVVAMATWVGAYAMGETVDKLIGWWDEWSDDAGKEGTGYKADEADAYGTSAQKDFLYHSITVAYTWLTFTAIIVGSVVFFNQFMVFKDVPGCDVTEVQESHYDDVRTYIASQTDLPTCKSAMQSIFRIADLDRNGWIDRCENAKFLYGIGNTAEYALSFSEIKTLPSLYQSCYVRFTDHFNSEFTE